MDLTLDFQPCLQSELLCGPGPRISKNAALRKGNRSRQMEGAMILEAGQKKLKKNKLQETVKKSNLTIFEMSLSAQLLEL